jgi:hypothetical protein
MQGMAHMDAGGTARIISGWALASLCHLLSIIIGTGQIVSIWLRMHYHITTSRIY